MDWLLSLPDPREGDDDGAFSTGGVLRPLRPSATQQTRLPGRQPGAGGNNSSSNHTNAAARMGGAGRPVVGSRLRRPGSAQHPQSGKLSRPSIGLSTPTTHAASVGNLAGSMSVSGGSAYAAGSLSKPTLGAPSAARPPTLGASTTDSSLVRKPAGGAGLTRTQSGLLPPRRPPGAGALAGAGGPDGNSSSSFPGSGGGSLGSMAGGSGLARGLPKCSASTGALLAGAPNSAVTAKRAALGTLGAAGAGAMSSGARAAAEGKAEGGADRSAPGNFKSEALELEVRLAEGLQKLAEAAADEGGESGEGETVQAANRRLRLCRSLFERIIERDAPFGRLLSRVKTEYESALASAKQPTEPQLEAAQAEVTRLRAELAASKRAEQASTDENAMLRAELSKMAQREAQMKEEMRAYQEHAYELQQAAVQQAEAEQAAITAELERELPPSARPGEVTPRLGGDNDVSHTCGIEQGIRPPPPRPSIVPALNMDLVLQKKAADARAEAEEEAEAKGHAGGGGGGGHRDEDDEDEGEEEDDEGDEDEDEDEEVEMARLHALQVAVANGTIDLAKGIPNHLMPKGKAGARLEAALGWRDEMSGDEEDEDEESYAAALHARYAAAQGRDEEAKPRVLEPAATADVPMAPKPAQAAAADQNGASGAAKATPSSTSSKPPVAACSSEAAAAPLAAAGGAGAPKPPAMPALNLDVMNDPSTRPEGYHQEFERLTAGAPIADERSKEVDAMLYSHDPTHGKTFAAAGGDREEEEEASKGDGEDGK